MNTDPSRDTLVDTLLGDASHHIEFKHLAFNGYLSNHNKHAVIALHRLGAPAERIAAYYDHYARNTYGYGLEAPHPSEHTITTGNWQRFLGQRSSYAAYCAFFDAEEKALGMDTLLARYLPTLLRGWVGALMHGTIHLGWALDAGHRWMIIEGLAYSAFAFVDAHPERNGPAPRDAEASPLASLLHVARAWEQDGDTLRAWLATRLGDDSDTQPIHPQLVKTGSQYRIAKVLAQGHPLMHAMPAWIDALEMPQIWEHLHYAATLLYMNRPGDFTTLHLITVLHALEHIVARLPAEHHKDAVRGVWTGLLAVMFSRGEFPASEPLAALDARYRDLADPDGPPAEGPDWDTLAARGMAEEEEHNPKLVYVQRRAWQRYGRRTVYRLAASFFTKTPPLPTYVEPRPAG